MHWYIEVLKKYAVFTGRARRKEYWMFFLFQVLISFVIGLIEGITNTNVLGMLFLLQVSHHGVQVHALGAQLKALAQRGKGIALLHNAPHFCSHFRCQPLVRIQKEHPLSLGLG